MKRILYPHISQLDGLTRGRNSTEDSTDFRVTNRQYNCWLSVVTINCVSSTLMVIALTFPKDLSEGNLT
ncbi:hypothetical protein AHAS_Ahas17G0282600 [Arachis hypogaea]